MELHAKDVFAKASSAGVIKVYASGNLTADASSASRIEYTGDPKVVDVTQSSAGVVQKG